MKPYAILSDLHCHGWSAFSTVDPNGINTRLIAILNEVTRAAEDLKKVKGDLMFLAGDIFHVRGKITPSVLNPVLDCFRQVREMGIEVHAIPGNHDLENKESDGIGNAMRALEGAGVQVHDEPFRLPLVDGSTVVMIPWCSTIAGLMTEIAKFGPGDLGGDCSETDLIIHAPINGVIMGIPDLGLSAEDVAAWGFKRVFAGHYHNHVDFKNGVYSIGATTHQTWSDVGSKAGFLLVTETQIKWRSTRAPLFIDITGEDSDEDVPLLVDGNYVRVKLDLATPKDIVEIREGLTEMGALGIVVKATSKPEVTRPTGAISAGETIDASIAGYIEGKEFDRETAVVSACMDILSEARSIEA